MSDLHDRLTAALADRYQIEQEVGRGATAVVFRAQDLKHGRPVAVKVLRPEIAASLGADRFLREIRIAASLTHPHILSVHDSGEARGLLYYVMPYVEGESLRTRLRREGPLPIEDAVRIAEEVADALAYAHSQGVVHRDIKPGNILLVGGHAVVADFGIAVSRTAEGEALTEHGLAIGTPPYMSPEQATGRGPVDGRSDVYSLGCVLFEMLTGQPPFSGPTPQAILARHTSDPVPRVRAARPSVPVRLEEVLTKSLAKLPADRFATALQFAEALYAPSMTPPPQPARARWLSGARGAVAAGLGAIAALTVLLGWSAWQARTHAGGIGVVVLPFETPGGANAQLADAHLALARAIEWLPQINGVDGAPLLAGRPTWRERPLPELLRAAARRGGRYLVTAAWTPMDAGEARGSSGPGSTDGSGGAGGGRVTLDVYRVATAERLARAEDTVQAARLDGVVSRLAAQSVAVIAEREGMLSGARRSLLAASPSATALGYLLQGQARFWEGDYDAAAAAFRAAIEADSGCGLAYFRLSVAEIWRLNYTAALATVERGLARARPEGAAPFLLRGQRYYLRGVSDSAIAMFQASVLDNRRDDIDGWTALGEALFHHGAYAGYRPQNARSAFERAIALDSTFMPLYDHLVDLAVLDGDAAAARRYVTAMPRSYRWRASREAIVAVRFGSPAQRAVAMARIRSFDRPNITSLAALVMHTDPALADTLGQFLLDRSGPPDDRRRGVHIRLAALTALGRWHEAFALWQRELTAGAAFDPWIVQAFLAGHPTEGVERRMFAWARHVLAGGAVPDFRREPRDDAEQAFQALVHRAVLHGDANEVAELLARLEAAPADSLQPYSMRGALRAALQARRALLAHDTAAAILALQRAARQVSEPWTWYYPLTTMGPERVLLTQLLERRGEPAEAQAIRESLRHTWAMSDALFAARAVGTAPQYP